MKKIATLLATPALAIGLVVAAPAFGLPGQDGTAPGAAADAKGAAALLEKTAEAYRKAHALTDRVKVRISPAGTPPEEFDVEYAFEGKTDAYVRYPGMSATALGDRVFVTRDDVPGLYLAVPLTKNLDTTMAGVFGADANLPVAFAMRAAKGTEAYLEALGLGLLQASRLVGHEEATTKEGRRLLQVNLTADNGSGRALIDPKTGLIEHVVVEASMHGPMGMQQISADLRHAPKVHTTTQKIVSFDPGDRTSVATFAELAPKQLAVGDLAPDFTLPALAGESVTLADLRGSVVVLDFWASWCGPCKRALPHLQEFDEWARDSGKPLRVFAINTMERAPSNDAIRDRAAKYWADQKYTIAHLLDYDSSVVNSYGIQSIPTTVVIAPDGRIKNIHRGFSPGMVANLKEDVQAAMQ